MFTGIIESLGKIEAVEEEGGNIHFTLSSDISKSLKPDQSVAHDGVCLTVIKADHHTHTVTAVEETLKKTNLKSWKKGKHINLERAMLLTDRLDGHIVQGHVDTTATCTQKEHFSGSINFTFSFPSSFASLIIEKGSICINGVSLTAFNCGVNQFTVTIIPFTLMHTTFQGMETGHEVNLEFDILGKYILRHQKVITA